MGQRIYDFEVSRLSEIASNIMPDYQEKNDQWVNSPFGWLKTLPSRRRGAAFERLVHEWCVENQLEVSSSPDSDADLVLAGVRVEVKGSTLWETGTYTFQQIRNQNYDVLLCLGICPFDAHCWAIPKDHIISLWNAGIVRSQHGGASGRDTAWITVNPAKPHDWMRPYGGSLDAGFANLKLLTRRPR